MNYWITKKKNKTSSIIKIPHLKIFKYSFEKKLLKIYIKIFLISYTYIRNLKQILLTTVLENIDFR